MSLSEEIKNHVTYTAMDSMELLHHSPDRSISNAIAIEGNLNPVLSAMRVNQFNALLDNKSPESYIEWQSHTPVLFSDMDNIRANNPGMDRKTIKSFSTFAKRNNTQWMDKSVRRNNKNCIIS